MKYLNDIEELKDLVVKSLIGDCTTLLQAANIRFVIDTLSTQHLLYVAASLGVIDDTSSHTN